jgi:hypothetical protein
VSAWDGASGFGGGSGTVWDGHGIDKKSPVGRV